MPFTARAFGDLLRILEKQPRHLRLTPEQVRGHVFVFVNRRRSREGYVQADAANVFDRLFNGQAASATEVGC